MMLNTTLLRSVAKTALAQFAGIRYLSPRQIL